LRTIRFQQFQSRIEEGEKHEESETQGDLKNGKEVRSIKESIERKLEPRVEAQGD
jgi:hypothetical protein